MKSGAPVGACADFTNVRRSVAVPIIGEVPRVFRFAPDCPGTAATFHTVIGPTVRCQTFRDRTDVAIVTPVDVPIGREVARAGQLLSRVFDERLAAVGGSLPIWFVLLSLKSASHRTQRELAEMVGIGGPTLTHHLNRLESDGLIERTRDPSNRRVQQVVLTAKGDALFERLRREAMRFDRELRHGLSERDQKTLLRVLERLTENASRSAPS